MHRVHAIGGVCVAEAKNFNLQMQTNKKPGNPHEASLRESAERVETMSERSITINVLPIRCVG